MIYLCTIFDSAGKPLISASLDGTTKECKFYLLYLSKTGLTLYEINKNKEKIRELFQNKVLVNDFKAHLQGFDLELSADYDAYDVPHKIHTTTHDQKLCKKILITELSKIAKIDIKPWQKLVASASIVYQKLENRGAKLGFQKVYPKYSFAVTGRSITSGFNIQGTTENDPIRHVDDEKKLFIHFDWIAADLRAASLLSNDSKMCESFILSDPYTMMANDFNDPEISRDDCKLELLRSIYSLQIDSPSLDYYNQFRIWMRSIMSQIKELGYTETLLGRKFFLENDNHKTIFNAAIQGTVAHAMQNSLLRIEEKLPRMTLTEVHDSIILSCAAKSASYAVSEVSKIMLHPFEGLLDYNPKFPLKVNIGKEWKKWKFCKEFR